MTHPGMIYDTDPTTILEAAIGHHDRQFTARTIEEVHHHREEELHNQRKAIQALMDTGHTFNAAMNIIKRYYQQHGKVL